MSPNPKPFVKTNTQQRKKRQDKPKSHQKQNEQQEQRSEERPCKADPSSRVLTLEEQLDGYADLLIDLYLNPQPLPHEEDETDHD